MTEPKPSLVIRSNIYPAKPGVPLLDDPAFLASISDPFSLAELKRHRRGSLLNDLQQWQSKKGVQCKLADEGDYPWGTKDITGTGRYEVVCLCKKTTCQLYEKCMERSPESLLSALLEQGDATGIHSVVERPLRFGVEDRNPSPTMKREPSTEWTADELKQLKECFAKYPREILYAHFPGKTVTDIEEHIKAVCFSGVSLPGATVTRRNASPSRETGNQKPNRQVDRRLEKKTARLKSLHAREWTSQEDRVIRENYPLYGTNLFLWGEQLYARKLVAIQERAEFLGVASPRAEATSLKKEENEHAVRGAYKQCENWEQLLIEKLYGLYGHKWKAWHRLVPWLSPERLQKRAEELGHGDVWTDAQKADYLKRHGLDWTTKELNVLLEFYPQRTHNSSDWLFDLPRKGRAERNRMANS